MDAFSRRRGSRSQTRGHSQGTASTPILVPDDSPSLPELPPPSEETSPLGVVRVYEETTTHSVNDPRYNVLALAATPLRSIGPPPRPVSLFTRAAPVVPYQPQRRRAARPTLYMSERNIQRLPDPPVPDNLLPYRSLQKESEAEYWRELHPEIPPYTLGKPIPKWIATKQRPYEYRHVHGLGTWQADIIEIQKPQGPTRQEQEMLHQGGAPTLRRVLQYEINTLQLFVAIHCNSRVAWVKKILYQNAETLDECLRQLRHDILPFTVDTLITDSGGGFIAMQEPVEHIYLNMSDPDQSHTGLALVDRFSRTLRDMLYNIRPVPVTEAVVKKLVEIYNTTPHETLSKTLGFLISPTEAFRERDIQLELIRRWSGDNYSKHSMRDWVVPEGTQVWIKNPIRSGGIDKKRNTVADDMYVVIGRIASNRYILRNLGDNSVKVALRSEIVLNFT